MRSWLLPVPGGPNRRRLVALSSQVSPAASAMTRALLNIGTTEKSKLSRVLPGSKRASARLRSVRLRPRSAISSSASAARNRAAGQPSLSATTGPHPRQGTSTTHLMRSADRVPINGAVPPVQ